MRGGTWGQLVGVVVAPPREQTIRAERGSYLEVTRKLPASARQVRPAANGGIILRATAPSVNLVSQAWSAPAGVTRFAVNGDVMLTACTSSTDASCERRDHDKVPVGAGEHGGGLLAEVPDLPQRAVEEVRRQAVSAVVPPLS